MRNPLFAARYAGLVLLAAVVACSAAPPLQIISQSDPSLGAPADGNGDSWAPVISPDGRYVLFASTAENLVSLDGSNGIPRLNPPSVNVYLRDRLLKTTTLVSVNQAGTGGGNGNSFPAALSTNGQYALFESAAADLVSGDTNRATDIFLRDLTGGVTRLVSVSRFGTSGNGASYNASMTPDGRWVAFASSASDLVPTLAYPGQDTNGIPDVFVRDMQADSTVLASVGAMSNGPAAASDAPEITPDGHYVAFFSTATNLVPGVATGGEIYVRDLLADATTWASTNARTISSFGTNAVCFNDAISDDGRFVAYEIYSNSVYAAAKAFVLRYDLQTGLTDVIHTNAFVPLGADPDKHSLNMSPDGRFIAFTANTNSATAVFRWDSQTGTNVLVSANTSGGVSPGTSVFSPDLDPAGRHVVFFSTDAGLTTNNAAGVFLRDIAAGATTLVSVDTDGRNLPVNSMAVPSLDGDGGSVAFESPWANLDGRNDECDVFARDLTNRVSELISTHAPALASVTPNGPSFLWPGSVSTNGRYVAFSSLANNLSAGDSNGCLDIYVRDRVDGISLLASVDTNGFAGNGNSTQPSLSGDGRFLAFASGATDLVPGDTNQASDIFVRDLQSAATSLVSVGTNGGFGNGDSYSPAISVDGRYVLFCSQAQNLAPGLYTNDNLFLRDLSANQTFGLTKGGYVSYAMTPDGHYVAFASVTTAATNLYVWDSHAAAIIYTNPSGSLKNVSISPDGRQVAYVAGTSLYVHDMTYGTNRLVGTGAFSPRAGLKFSSDGRFLVYAATNVYLCDLLSGTNFLVSHAATSSGPANGPSDLPAISPDGYFVAYRSFASNSVSGDSNGVPDVYLFDRLTNKTMLASATMAGVSANNRSYAPVFSGDGRSLVFQSWASDLAPQDFNSGADLFALDISSFDTTLATNSSSIFSLELSFSGSAFGQAPIISWPYVSGKTYSVQYKDNLTDPLWHTLNAAITVLSNQVWVSDTNLASGHRFYRVVSGN